MSKTTQRKQKKHKKKFNYLSPNSSVIQTRQETIETYYVDGLKDKEGRTVIRALNDSEKEFLNQFYKEWFGKTEDSDEIKELKVQYEKSLIRIRTRLLKNKKELEQQWGAYGTIEFKRNLKRVLLSSPTLKNLRRRIEKLRKEQGNLYYKMEDVKEIHDLNNSRNRDLYSKLKIEGKMHPHDQEILNRMTESDTTSIFMEIEEDVEVNDLLLDTDEDIFEEEEA